MITAKKMKSVEVVLEEAEAVIDIHFFNKFW